MSFTHQAILTLTQRLRAQSCETSPRFRGQLQVWAPSTSDRLAINWGFYYLPLRFNNLATEQLIERRRGLYLLLPVHCIQSVQLRCSRMEEVHRARCVRRDVELPHSPWVRHPPSTLMCSTTWKLSKPLCLGFLWRFHYTGVIDYVLDHWWLNSVFSPFPFPRGGG